jgi:hypothetical protein
MKKYYKLGIALLVPFAMLFQGTPMNAIATPWLPDNFVNEPVAHSSGGQFLPVVDSFHNAEFVNQIYTDMYGEGWPYMQMVWTGNFSGSAYDPDAPDNATIQEVYIVAVVKNSWVLPPKYYNEHWRTFRLSYGFGTESEPPDSFPLGEQFSILGDYWREITYRVTNLETWTPAMVKSHSLYTFITSTDASTVYSSLQVDYVGIMYNWTAGPTDYEGSDFIPPGTAQLGFISPIGMIGLFGFIGMIATPVAAVWFYRNNGGSKIYFGVMALVTFTVCFGFFYASINGG